MSRYNGNLYHWKTKEKLNPTNCFTGDEYTKENTKLRMVILEHEYKIKDIKKDNQDGIYTKKLKELESNLELYKQQYEKDKSKLIKNASFEMFPDNTIIHCQLISHDGKNIKSDGTFGYELVWARVCDQRCFKKDILYAVTLMGDDKNTNNFYSTRASLVNWPRPNNHGSIHYECILDNSIKGPPWLSNNKYVAGSGLPAIRCLSSNNLNEEDDEKEYFEKVRRDMKTS